MRSLFAYELKKIWQRRILWVSMVLSILLILITVGGPLLGSYYVNGERVGSNYEEFQIDKAYQKALDGRAIDEALISEMQKAYSKVPFEEEKYSQTEAYQKYARPYSAIYHYVRQTIGLSGSDLVQWEASVDDLHALRQAKMERNWDSILLTEEEKTYWRATEETLEKPQVFRYAECYQVLFSAAYSVGCVVLFIVVTCLSGVFPEEHLRRTDQLILSSKWGRKNIFVAKFAAGAVSAFFLSLVPVLVAVAVAVLLYGAEGFDAAFQLIYVGNSHPVSVGEAVTIIYIVIVIAGVFMGTLVMMLSELLHSNISALAVGIGIILLPMLFSMPQEYRVLSQLWSYLPGDFVAGWSCFGMYTVTLFGKIFLPWQIVPICYIMLGLLFGVVTGHRFVTYQVKGR
ncbi:MAG: ABC transporter permease subunit [Lachnospiraceae bacterium]|nr:ABC transporter permease subunit [Lachnospiraceae bacterium]